MNDWNALTEGTSLELIVVDGVVYRPGGRVRLCPRGRADIMDLILAGKEATIDSIEQDYENRVYLAVTVDDDPGKDLGTLRRPGHRFFFGTDEVELLDNRVGGEG